MEELDHQEVTEVTADLSESFFISEGVERTKVDRYRDFRMIFYGSDAGKRVLYDILGWAGIYRPETPEHGEINIHRVMEKIGKKKLGLDILSTLSKKPKEPGQGVVHNRKE